MERFRVELTAMEEHYRRCEVPDHIYNNCKEKLSELLSVLENVVEDSVIEVASKIQTTQNQQLGISPQIQSWLNLQSWAEMPIAQAITRFLHLPSKDYTPSHALPLPGRASIGPETEILSPRYLKLESLSLIIQKRSIPKKEIASSCVKFIKLKQTLGRFQEAVRRATVAKMCIVDIAENHSPIDQVKIRMNRKIPSSNWRNPIPWEITYRLFNMLSEKTCPGHEARFQLNGFKMDSEGERLPLDVFISSCPRDDPPGVSPSWQEGRCTYFMHDIIPTNDGLTFITDLCFPGPNKQQTQPSPPVSDIRIIEFDKSNAYQRWLSTEYSICRGATPTISLAYLLDNGFLRDLDDGGVFEIGDKAVLALSLGRCLLHCFQGLLMQQEWSSHNIHFLYQRTTSTEGIFNIHHPYVTCHFPKTVEERMCVSRYSTFLQDGTPLRSEVKPNDCAVFLWSFARLLLEIERGQRIPLLSEPDILESFNRRSKNSRWEYFRAINGCMSFADSLRRKKGETPNLSEVREVLYDEVLQYLDGNINSFSDDIRTVIAQRDVSLKASVSKPLQNTLDIEIKFQTAQGSKMNQTALLDTGADANFMSQVLSDLLEYTGSPYTGRGYNTGNGPIAPLGKVQAEFRSLKSQKWHREEFFVVHGLPYDMIFGKAFIDKYDIFRFEDRRLLPIRGM
ncbi:hypothetical protein O1611_g461 [Lasiodiplodia mahajangana]|uniref:Uncharacterized protein n=1 Tax=Lasiodiplodia mahajangana TaxID=1108764 RepID=A0ACC2K050_9PEZI|nr:hypothetical protein O1611_g461 [Lasiodiplodia mahajangana]